MKIVLLVLLSMLTVNCVQFLNYRDFISKYSAVAKENVLSSINEFINRPNITVSHIETFVTDMYKVIKNCNSATTDLPDGISCSNEVEVKRIWYFSDKDESDNNDVPVISEGSELSPPFGIAVSFLVLFMFWIFLQNT